MIILPTAQAFLRVQGGTSFDPNAAAFFTATSMSNSTVENAVNQLCLDLKSYGLFSLLKFLNPVASDGVNQTRAQQHQYNLINTATYLTTFTGSPTHSANGILWNGTTSYADFGWNTSVEFTNTAGFMGLYCRSHANVSGEYDVANDNAGSTNATVIIPTYSTNAYYGLFGSSSYPNASNPVGTGFYNTSAGPSLFALETCKNGSTVLSTTDAMVYENSNLFWGACNHTGTGAIRFSTAEHAMLMAGQVPFDGTQCANLYTAVQAYQTALGRQV